MATPSARIEIVAPTPADKFTISEAPAMPVIHARARISGVTPDPTPTTIFKWTASIDYNAAQCANGPARTIRHTPIVQAMPGGAFVPAFKQIRGGILTLAVEAHFGGRALTASVTGIKIVAVNPSNVVVAQKCPDKTLRQISRHESGMRQFESNGACPLWSKDKLGGVGIAQITNPKPTDDEVWDWTANLTRAQKILKEKEAVAAGYPAKVRNSNAFQTLVAKFNQARQTAAKAALTVTLPDFNADQLRLDMIRGFNGFAGTDSFGNVLHEFRVPLDAAGNLIAAEQPGGKTAIVAWQQVPAADRPQRVGDPNYVANVTRQRV
jgi:hypothetical protein